MTKVLFEMKSVCKLSKRVLPAFH
ncbi:hypothetical protein [Metabacillus sediminilitoris]